MNPDNMHYIEYHKMDLYVYVRDDDGTAFDITVFEARKGNVDIFHNVEHILTDAAKAEIRQLVEKAWREDMNERAEEARFIRESCYDTPYAY